MDRQEYIKSVTLAPGAITLRAGSINTDHMTMALDVALVGRDGDPVLVTKTVMQRTAVGTWINLGAEWGDDQMHDVTLYGLSMHEVDIDKPFPQPLTLQPGDELTLDMVVDTTGNTSA